MCCGRHLREAQSSGDLHAYQLHFKLLLSIEQYDLCQPSGGSALSPAPYNAMVGPTKREKCSGTW